MPSATEVVNLEMVTIIEAKLLLSIPIHLPPNTRHNDY